MHAIVITTILPADATINYKKERKSYKIFIGSQVISVNIAKVLYTIFLVYSSTMYRARKLIKYFYQSFFAKLIDNCKVYKVCV